MDESKVERMRGDAERSASATVREMRALFARLADHAATVEGMLQEVLESRSWRITRPIRKLVSRLAGSPFHELVPPSGGIAALATQARELLDAGMPAAGARLRGAAPLELRDDAVFIFTGVPYDDIGGGQRAAQLARVALARGHRVVYVYAYRKWEAGVEVDSRVDLRGMSHVFLDEVRAAEIIEDMRPGDTALFEIPHPVFIPFLRAARERRVLAVFEMIDAWDSSLGGDWFDPNVLAEFVRVADRVTGTARVLRESLVRMGRRDAIYLPNAYNETIFDLYRTLPRPPEYLPGKRVLLYFGSLYGEWFDWDAIRATAARSPEAVVYLIGDYQGVEPLPANVILLGSRQIDQLPAYLAHAEVALLPFKPGHISDAVSPIKVFEYLAMGVPVVSNDLPEVRGYPNVHIARSVEDFAGACAKPLVRQVDDGFLMSNSWASRLDAIVQPARLPCRISVVVLMHNNEAIIGRCLESLRLHGACLDLEVIVVDNASQDGGAARVRRDHPEVRLVSNGRNGCSSGRNLGVAHSTGRYLMFLDSDQWLVSRSAFEEAVALLRSRPDIGAVGWAAGWFDPGNADFGGPIVDYLPDRGRAVAEYVEFGVRTDVAYLGSGGLMTTREIFDQVGGFDEAYDPTCFEDTDFSLAIKAAGFRIAYRDLQGIRHQAHQTTGAGARSDAYERLFKRNAAYFGSKWSSRPELLRPHPGGL